MDLLLTSQPEAAPWLDALSTVLEEAADPAWDDIAAATTMMTERSPGTPVLAGARIPVNARVADQWVRRLLVLAADVGPEAIVLRAAAGDNAFETRAFLEAAVN